MAGFLMITSTTTCAVGLIFFSVCYLPAAPVAALSFDYPTFGPEDKNDIRVEGDAYISAGWIDVTANRLTSIAHSKGRASYNAQPMLLWDKTTGEVASFTTRFSFAINMDLSSLTINNKGTGMAFFLAGYPSSMPADSYAYNMCLTNQSADAVATGDSRFVAVEFDTFNDTIAFDPHSTYDHVGIDVNSIRSVATESLPSFSLRGNMTAEIKYHNLSSILEMTLWLGDGTRRYLSHKVDLKSVLPENVSVGFSASTSTSTELHQLYSWYFSSSLEPKAAPVVAPPPLLPPSPTPRTSGSGNGGVIAGAAVGAALFLVLLFAMAALFARRRRSKKRREAEELEDIGGSDDDGDEPIMEIEMGTGPRRFPYHELVDATRSFAPEEKLGQGGFGSVYRGYLRERGLVVAIKRFAKGSSMQGMKEYKSEIKVISRIRHRNLVQLIGWCHGRDELLLVYELVPNRSLDVHLHGNGTFLTWPMRIKIVLGLGSALLYLHEEWEQCVVHRDVKPSNVMLDESFNAKLGDFGLARFIDHAVGMQTMTAVSGTPGYVDPECLITSRASAESDVYSFGVVLLEVVCGRRPMSLLDSQKNAVFRLVEWVWDLYGQGAALAAADERLNSDYDAAEMERVVAVGLWCAHPDPRARPSIRAAMAVLQSNGLLPELPAKMPVPTYAPPVSLPEGLFSYSASSTGTTSSSLTQSSTTSGSSDASTSTGVKDSSSLLKHQY
ncbi:L-type lectin-domain containing receptor kinase IX.1-like [Phragmites australis]|uniref:L-type lectin-domain containing receptor kinase IX.1-like n=1 Tax=Phragmites australis TaxID=29695 RepID=UPI002D7778BD|nr:L-type lectin-domain containing receptor kinase IX.1-like [Phragmites australis]